MGLHNEHHDFPFIAGSRLHALRAIAPEFYEPLATHGSWVAVLTGFVGNANLGPWARTKRCTLPASELAEIRAGIRD